MKQCPKCGSDQVLFRSAKHQWLCGQCDHEWQDPVRDGAPSAPETHLKIFLSYGHDDYLEDARLIKRDLERRGHKVWFDEAMLKPGCDYALYIEDGLKWCDKVVLLMTPHSVRRRKLDDPTSKNGFCLNEIAAAMDRNKLIVPVLLVTLEDGPPVTINCIQYLDLRDVVHISEHPEPYQHRFDLLVQAVEHDVLDFQGGQSRLIQILKPLDYTGDIAPHVARFHGREWLVAELDKWIREKPRSRVFWLTGAPGVGKSAFCAHLCHNRGDVVAKHFCVRDHEEKSDARQAILSIAYQLSQQIHDYETRLQALDLGAIVKMNTQTLFDRLLVQPFAAEGIPIPDGPRLVVIDALDEASHNGHNEIAELIRDQWYKTPDWLRLVITSRPESEVVEALAGYEPYVFRAFAAENTADLARFLKQELARRNIVFREEDITAIVAKSEGVFLYLTMLLRELDEGRLALQEIERFPHGLGAFYFKFFERNFPDPDQYRRDVAPVVEVLCAQRQPLAVDQLAAMTGLDRLKVDAGLARLSSLFPPYPAARGASGPVARDAFHKSVTEWLTSRDRRTGLFAAGRYAIDPLAANKRIADSCWAAYERGRGLSDYAASHLVEHLRSAEDWPRLAVLLADANYFTRRAQAATLSRTLREWSVGIDAIRANQACDAETIAGFLRPVLPSLIVRLEENFGVTGALRDECLPLVGSLSALPAGKQLDLFAETGRPMSPAPRGETHGEARSLTCLVQVYMEVGEFTRAHDLALMSIDRYPDSLQLRHFAAVSARYQSECCSKPEEIEAWLKTAIRIEEESHHLANAKQHGVYQLTLSVIAQSKCYLARLYRAHNRLAEARQLAAEAKETMRQRFTYGASSLALAFLGEIFLENGEVDNAWQVGTIATDADWFVTYGQRLVLELGESQPVSRRYLPPFERHLREWSLLAGPWYSDAQRKQAAQRYVRFLVERGLLPEAVARFPEETAALQPEAAAKCAAGRQGEHSIMLRIHKWRLETTVTEWRFQGQTDWTVIGLPELNLYARGETLAEATEYLRSFIQQASQRIAGGQYRHLRASDHLAMQRWVESRLQEARPEDVCIGELRRLTDAYNAGHLEEADRLCQALQGKHDRLTSEELCEFFRVRSRVQARRGYADGLGYLMNYAEYNRISLLTVTDFLAVYRFHGLFPSPQMEEWLALGRPIAEGEGKDPVGARSLFFEYWGCAEASRGNLAKARALLEKALAVEEDGMKELRILTRIRSNLAEVLRRQGDPGKARELLKQVAKEQAENGFDGDLAEYTLTGLAKAQPSREEALGTLRQALALAERLQFKKAILRAILLEARIGASPERRDEILNYSKQLASGLPAVGACPLMQRIHEHWPEWCGQTTAGDFWGL